MAQEEHEFGDGAFRGAVISAYHTRLDERQTRLVESHLHASGLALRDVDEEDATAGGFLQFVGKPLQAWGIACPEGTQYYGAQAGDVEHTVYEALLDAREEGENHDVGIHEQVRLEGLGGVGTADEVLVVLDVDAHGGQFGEIERAEGIEAVGMNLRGTVATQQFVLEVYAHLGYHGRAVGAAGRSNLYGRDEVLLAVGAQHADGELRTGQDDGFGQVLQHEAEGGGGVGHRVGAVQDDEPVEIVVVVVNDTHQFGPVVQTHVGGVDGGRKGVGGDAAVKAPQFGNLLQEAVEIEVLQGSRFLVAHHAYGSARVDEEHRGTVAEDGILPFFVAYWFWHFVVCEGFGGWGRE